MKTHRILHAIYGLNNRPSECAIHRVIEYVYTHFIFNDLWPPTRMRPVRFEENIAVVEANVDEKLNLSIRRHAQQLGFCTSTVQKILRRFLVLMLIRFN